MESPSSSTHHERGDELMDDVGESKVEDADVEEELHAASDDASAQATAGVTPLKCGGAKAAAESPGSGKSSGASFSHVKQRQRARLTLLTRLGT
eukprot:jgi/Tetstr1/435005/TSEL_002604.t1